jgi:hypothetical protein
MDVPRMQKNVPSLVMASAFINLIGPKEYAIG